jgi:hypothetical protein
VRLRSAHALAAAVGEVTHEGPQYYPSNAQELVDAFATRSVRLRSAHTLAAAAGEDRGVKYRALRLRRFNLKAQAEVSKRSQDSERIMKWTIGAKAN